MLLLSTALCSAQDTKWILRQLKDKGNEQAMNFKQVRDTIMKMDIPGTGKLIEELEEKAGNNSYAIARLFILKADHLTRTIPSSPVPDLTPMTDSYEKAIKKAIETGDEILIADCCSNYGLFCVSYNIFDKAMFYLVKSMELQEKNSAAKFPHNTSFKIDVANVLYKVQEYDLSIRYMQEGIAAVGEKNVSGLYNLCNTIGLSFQKTARYDSAHTWYNKALQLAIVAKDTAWQGIIVGNIGDAYYQEKKYDNAKKYLLEEFEINRSREYSSAYNSLQFVARILIKEGKTDSAMKLIREIETIPHDNKNYYETKAEVFTSMKMSDSALYYYRLYQHINDSAQEKTMKARMDITQLKLEYEKSNNQVDRMLKEKKHEKTKRILLAAGLILVILTGFLLYRMQRNRNQLQQKLLVQQKQAAEEAMLAAKQQLDQFTGNIVEKNKMIETLQAQLQQRNEQINDELLKQTILTDEDWIQFKSLFEKARPGFFEKLQRSAPGITTAELRLAALISLNLDTKHIAAMQGTSADTVRKSKSRLRQRINITPEEDLEALIRNI